MKKLLYNTYKHRYFLLFILLFAYVQSIYTRISVRRVIDAYVFTPEAALATLVDAGLLFLVILFFIRRWQKDAVFKRHIMLKIFAVSLLIYMLIMLVSGFSIALLFDTVARNFNRNTFILSTFSNFLDGFIYGSFFLAYYYYQSSKKQQKQFLRYNEVLAESKINQLKTQLNPHFLFNNLHVLDQLIEEDKYKASDFLNEFADIYRYVLQGADKKLVYIEEELDFAQQYFRLIHHKYGDAYQLKVAGEIPEGFIVPLTLQLLIENAVQHNLGTAMHPVFITVTLSDRIYVSNTVNLKRKMKPTSGRALGNLKEQYRLLTQQSIIIAESKSTFSVSIPFINNVTHVESTPY
ncbi:sensor histidine kinase [Sphingobacterium sp. MYb382]|uniref:sensor histidine kinase n=1 Tax=Sphingobacterium sp. MYb382 TaxID=2745278 RepID=UPI00309C5B0A